MTIFDFLKNPIFNLPISDPTKSYEMIFIEVMNPYLELLDELGDFYIGGENPIKINAEELSDNVHTLCDVIINTLKDYYNGKPYEAFYGFKEFLDSGKFNFETTIKFNKNGLYRLRLADPSTKLKLENMFHIPYQEKHKIASQRYSIPGFPSLYLADSIYTCWQELNKPSIEKIHVSEFRLSARPYRFIEIPHPQRIIQNNINNNAFINATSIRAIEALLLNFPLYLACSVGVKCQKDPFKVEYVIPQLLLQYARQNDSVDGIKYFSTNLNCEISKIEEIESNYVFPVQEVSTHGYCPSLSSIFRITKPVSMQTLTAQLETELPLNNGIKDEYSDTAIQDYFHKTQLFLHHLDANKLT